VLASSANEQDHDGNPSIFVGSRLGRGRHILLGFEKG
jgi:hypothetical protein